MAYLVVLLSVLALTCAGYLALVLRQLRSVSRQLERRAVEGTHHAVSIQLVNGVLNDLVARVNDTIREAESATARSRADEQRFRSLIADISHDLRTPLTAVRGYQQILARSELTEAQSARLAVAGRNADELGSLIDHLFEYASVMEAEPELSLERFDVVAVVTEGLIDSAQGLAASGLDVRFDPPGPVFATCDRERVTRIVHNLVRNACQHAEGLLAVEVGATPGESVRIAFTNPVRSEDRVRPDRLFERFYTGDSSRNRSTGLGLSIVRVLAEQLGGAAAASLRDGLLTIAVELPHDPRDPSAIPPTA